MFVFGEPTKGDEVVMRAFKLAQYSSPQDDQKWCDVARAFFESLTPFQRDVLGEMLWNYRDRERHSIAKDELARLGEEWRRDRLCDVDWVTRSTWPL